MNSSSKLGTFICACKVDDSLLLAVPKKCPKQRRGTFQTPAIFKVLLRRGLNPLTLGSVYQSLSVAAVAVVPEYAGCLGEQI